MKKIILPIVSIVLSLSLVSCVKDFAERNTNPEQANEEMLEHDNLRTGSYIAQMMANVLPSYQRGEKEYGSASYQVVQGLTGNIFANYEAASNAGFHQTNEYNLISDGWTKALFEDAYTRAISAWTELNAVREVSPYDAALGDILKVAFPSMIQRLFSFGAWFIFFVMIKLEYMDSITIFIHFINASQIVAKCS